MVYDNLNVSALKGLNIRIIELVQYSTPPGLPESYPVLPWVVPTVIGIKPLRG